MTTHLSLGAIKKSTGEYVPPKMANKADVHCCPTCNKEVIVCQGDIRKPYYRHKVDTNPCQYYCSPSESQIHKDAKSLLKMLFESRISIVFTRTCSCCRVLEEYEIPEMTESSSIVLEYRFEYNGPKVADVAYLDNGEIVAIFEICHTHRTDRENRPEPWFELDATGLIQQANDMLSSGTIYIACIRKEKCEECLEKDILLKEERKQQQIMAIRNSNRIKLPLFEKELEIKIKDDTSMYYTSTLLTKLEAQVRNIKSELEIKLIENGICYHNNDNVEFIIRHPNNGEIITLHSILSYSIIEILDWYYSVPNKFNIIDCRFKVEILISNLWESVKYKDIVNIDSLLMKLEEYIKICVKHKYYHYADRIHIIKHEMLNLEVNLVKNNIGYSKQETAGLPIYLITLPDTKETVKYAMASGKVYKNKKWHTKRELNLYNLLFYKYFIHK
jgi:uncharacterized protein YkuJ